MFELTVILRQVNGMPFACTLNRLRVGEPTEADLALLRSFDIDLTHPPAEYSVFLRHIFATHKQLDKHNDLVFDSLAGEPRELRSKLVIVLAPLSYRHRDQLFFLDKARKMPVDKLALPSVFRLKVNMILEITLNLDIPDGLYHGAWGHLKAMELGSSSLDVLWIQFADVRVGRQARKAHATLLTTRPEIPSTWTPLFKTSRELIFGHFQRRQWSPSLAVPCRTGNYGYFSPQ